MAVSEEGLEAKDVEAGSVNHPFQKSGFESAQRTKADKEKTKRSSAPGFFQYGQDKI